MHIINNTVKVYLHDRYGNVSLEQVRKADYLAKGNGVSVVAFGIGGYGSAYALFLCNEKFNDRLRKWQDKFIELENIREY